MIISPPFIRDKFEGESDAAWIDRMMPLDTRRDFPVNANYAWHGGIHILHSDKGSNIDYIRAIADGTVVSLRQPNLEKRDKPPFYYIGGTDCGYILLKHETEIGSGVKAKIVYYSLYMHLKSIVPTVTSGTLLYRKDPLGTVGQVDGKNAIHFQIFCDDDNLSKIFGRTKPQLNINDDGRMDAVYGDIHFYLPAGTPFYEKEPENDQENFQDKLKYTSVEPLYVTMHFDKGHCSLSTRAKDILTDWKFIEVGEALITNNFEYDLYELAVNKYSYSISAGYELLRFGRVINTSYETLIPQNAAHWRAINYPGGNGYVNLALKNVKKYSDGDFPHWMGWCLINDDAGIDSNCNSPSIIRRVNGDLSRMICYFPLEWDKLTVETRFRWLLEPNEAGEEPMNIFDWKLLTDHGKALCLEGNALPTGRVWHFDPKQFITHFRKCGWLSKSELSLIYPDKIYPLRALSKIDQTPESIREKYREVINRLTEKYFINTPTRKSHFFGQGAVESQCLSLMIEGVADFNRNPTHASFSSEDNGYYNPPAGGYLDYLNDRLGNIENGDGPKFRGRGMKQLTGRENYSKYWGYRGWIDISLYQMTYKGFILRWWDPTNTNVAPPIPDPQRISTNNYNCIDIGGWYWEAGSRKNNFKSINRNIIEGNVSFKHSQDITRSINGGLNGDKERSVHTIRIAEIFFDK